jgi:hypothetical protein
MRRIERFDKYMAFKGLNDNKVTVDLGLSNGTIGKSRKNGRDLSDRVIEQILNFYTDLNKVWLLTGEGEMLNKTIHQEAKGDNNTQVAGNGNNVNVTTTSLLEELAAQRKLTEKAQEQLSKAQEQIDRLLSIIEKLNNN